jgi:5'-3' exonuclease
VKLYLVDGTYELFRYYFGAPKKKSPAKVEVGAVTAMLRGTWSWLRREKVAAVGVAFDTVVESFRNGLYAGYKSGAGIPEDLLSQFPLAEEALSALGLRIWPMKEFEADDAIATAAHRWADSGEFEQILICSPDKDFSQCVTGRRVVCLDRRHERIIDEAAVRERFGVPPASIPDWQALVGDSADGYPGIPGWGRSSATAVLSAYHHLEQIPRDPDQWDRLIRGRARLASALFERWDDALLYRKLATLRTDAPIQVQLEDLLWDGPRPQLQEFCRKIGDFSFKP